MRNPNGYGSIVKLSGNRRRPYMVRKTVGWDTRGYPIYDIIGYAPTREDGMIMLATYNKDPWDVDKSRLTFEELYQLWLIKRAPKLSEPNQKALKSAYKHCSALYNLKYANIKAYQMQDIIDTGDKSYSVQGKIKALLHNLDKFAIELDVIKTSYSDLLTTAPAPDHTSRAPFTEDEIDALWAAQDKPWVDSVLIYLYTGWRLNELLDLKTTDIDLDQQTMTGGSKTASGKNRLVPIHTRILPLVQARAAEGNEYLISHNGQRCGPTTYYKFWHEIMDSLGMSHVVHECRHTFRTRLDNAGANQVCIDLLMGHKSQSVGERVYTHKTVEELRQAVELLT